MLRLALTYLIALIPALALIAGLILVIEMAYHVSVKASEGPTISLLHVALNTTSATPWVVAAVLVAGGFFLFRLTWPLVGAAWHDAFMQAHGSVRAK
jgi:branched-chain amino acid transport system permease protein